MCANDVVMISTQPGLAVQRVAVVTGCVQPIRFNLRMVINGSRVTQDPLICYMRQLYMTLFAGYVDLGTYLSL